MKLSVIICTLNSEKYIANCIDSVKKIKPYEIIIVDGNSKDKTVEIVLEKKCKVVYDSAIGLGNARNIGLVNARGDYVIYIGPDNMIDRSFDLFDIVQEMETNGWAGIGLRTKLLTINDLDKGVTNYLKDGLSFRWDRKIQSGESQVIGTPFLFSRDVLNKFTFNAKSKFSDDTDLCKRMLARGLKVGYSKHQFAFDIWHNVQESINNRFIMYGKSDREFFKANYKNWTIGRVIKSLLHPFSEFRIIRNMSELKYVPFIIYIIFYRYLGYAKIY
ncbi:MAG: glycosyltransferase family 2 protein [Candidatus Pacearchaeota archaeon]